MQITTFNPMILTSIENSERANDKMFILWEPPGSVSKAPKNAVFIRKTGTF